jgi:hypothetical protein
MKRRPDSPSSRKSHEKDNFVAVRRTADKNVVSFSRIPR